VDFVCCDLPDLNTLTLGIFATFAQHEAERISQRTKDGLRAAKRKGVVLGMPANLTKQARAKGMKARINNARTATANIQASELIKMYNKDGLSLRTIASKLNESGYTTRRGAEFTAMQVKRLLDR
jgi:DNA invertase Pin-like site-specific DNA recombinase